MIHRYRKLPSRAFLPVPGIKFIFCRNSYTNIQRNMKIHRAIHYLMRFFNFLFYQNSIVASMTDTLSPLLAHVSTLPSLSRPTFNLSISPT